MTKDKTTDESTQEVKNKENSSSVFKLMLVIVLILALAALCASGYVYWMLQQASLKNSKYTSELKQKLAENDPTSLIADLTQQLQTQEGQINLFQEQLNNSKLETSKSIRAFESSLAEIKATNKNEQPLSKDYLLSELEHLLILANNRIRIANDVRTAVTALEAVENRLQQAEGNDLLLLREQVIEDLNSLQSVNDVDIKGLSLYLANMAANTDALPVANLFREDEKIQEAIQSRGTDFESVSDFLATLWTDIKAMILVTPEVNQTEAVMLRGESYFLKHNLRLELLTARIAVLNKDTENFQTSVKQSIEWLNDYFDNSDAAVSNMHDALAKMQDIQLAPSLPDISSSLETIRAVIREQSETGNDGTIN